MLGFVDSNTKCWNSQHGFFFVLATPTRFSHPPTPRAAAASVRRRRNWQFAAAAARAIVKRRKHHSASCEAVRLAGATRHVFAAKATLSCRSSAIHVELAAASRALQVSLPRAFRHTHVRLAAACRCPRRRTFAFDQALKHDTS